MKYLSGLSKHQLGWESFTLEIGLSKKTSHPLALTIHPKALGFPYILICKRKIPFNIGILASVGPIVSMCLHAPFPLPFYLVFI